MKDGGTVLLESGVTTDVRSHLVKRGHKVESKKGGYGGFQGILYDAKRDIYIGASESRKDGQASGY